MLSDLTNARQNPLSSILLPVASLRTYLSGASTYYKVTDIPSLIWQYGPQASRHSPNRKLSPSWERLRLRCEAFDHLNRLSFVPQCRRIIARRDCVGISPYYVLLNLIVATEQFGIGCCVLLSQIEHPPREHNSLTLGD